MARKDRYWRRYGSARFDFKTRHRYVELCRAITRSISVRCRRFLRLNKDYDVVFISMYNTEPKRRYWWSDGSAGFRMRNQPCLHIKNNYFIETWYFLIILLVYYRVCIHLIHYKLLYEITKRKGFIFPPSHGIPSKWWKKIDLKAIRLSGGASRTSWIDPPIQLVREENLDSRIAFWAHNLILPHSIRLSGYRDE
jgi:hypothetical protein